MRGEIKEVREREKRKRFEWERHTELINSPLPSLSEVVEKISSINNIMLAACIALIYLTGSRVSEIIRLKDRKTKEILLPSIKRSQIVATGEVDFGEEVGPKWIEISTRVLKIPEKRLKHNARLGWKKAFIDCEDERYSPLLKILDQYLDEMENQRDDAELFTFSYHYIFMELDRRFNWNAHFLRHLRASHLVKYHNFLDTDLRKLFGWITGEMPSRYTHGSEEQLKAKLSV